MKTFMPVMPGVRRGYSHTRPVVTVDDLFELRGPRDGLVTLLIHIDWTPTSTYDLSKRRRVRSMYEVVLREAHEESELKKLLNHQLLLEHWEELNISAFIRQTWVHHNPVLENPHSRGASTKHQKGPRV